MGRQTPRNCGISGADYLDHIRLSLESLDLLLKPNTRTFCLLPEFFNVRGDECVNSLSTVLIGYGWAPGTTLYMNSYYSPAGGFSFRWRNNE